MAFRDFEMGVCGCVRRWLLQMLLLLRRWASRVGLRHAMSADWVTAVVHVYDKAGVRLRGECSENKWIFFLSLKRERGPDRTGHVGLRDMGQLHTLAAARLR